MVSELVAETRNAAKALAKFLGDDERGGEVLIEDFHVLVSAMGLLNSSADRIEALEAALKPFDQGPMIDLALLDPNTKIDVRVTAAQLHRAREIIKAAKP